MNVSASLSGLRAADTLLAVSVHNVANAQTPGFRAQRAELAEAPGRSGVAVTAVTQDGEPDATDLGSELVGTMLAAVTYRANLAVIRTQDETTGSLLSLRA